MNIFYLSRDPEQAARWHTDRHVVAMIRESCQMLATAHRVLDGEEIELTITNPDTGKSRKKKRWVTGDCRDEFLCEASHVNHPSTVWARSSVRQYSWLCDLTVELCVEKRHRWPDNRPHAWEPMTSWLLQNPPINIVDDGFSDAPTAMPDEYRMTGDAIASYRLLYTHGKSHLHRWSLRDEPEWISSLRDVHVPSNVLEKHSE